MTESSAPEGEMPTLPNPLGAVLRAWSESYPRMDIWAKPGSLVMFDGRGGYESEKTHAAKLLTLRRVYEVESINVGSSSSTVALKGVNGLFNTVLFSEPPIFAREYAATSAAQAAGGGAWQPIETAPKDGFFLVHEGGAIRALLRSDGKFEHLAYPALISHPWGDVIVGCDAARYLPDGWRLEVRDGCCESPTHWMPLPAAPDHPSPSREGPSDAEMLDWLDSNNRALNEHYGTTYGWAVVLSPNVTRVMTERRPADSGHVADVDVHDSRARGHNSIRAAISAAMKEHQP
jgi:hypothetical protein